MKSHSLWLAVVPLVGVVTAQAEVLDSAANGFSIKTKVVIGAPRAAVYGEAVDGISRWWNSDHTISGNAENLYITAKPQGCFCEKLGANAGLVHLLVTFVNPGTVLRFTGGLGPLGLMGVSGNMTWEFNDHEMGTEVILSYAVGGYLDGGLDAIAPAVDQVLLEQMTNLKQLLESSPRERHP